MSDEVLELRPASAAREGVPRLMREVERVARAEELDPGERGDLVQETLLRVWARLGPELGEDPTAGLVRTVLARIRIDRWRDRPRGSRVPADELVARARSPLEDAQLAELRATIRRVLATLPEPQREVAEMRLDEGRKFREIAAHQGVPLGTALSRMRQAMLRLRSELEDHLGDR